MSGSVAANGPVAGRDTRVIRAITTETGDLEGQFDRNPLPSVGISRATGKDTLLYANGPTWRKQKKLAVPPFGKTTLFQPEQFHEFAETFRHTVRHRASALEKRLESVASPVQVRLEPEIKVAMLEMLANNFFGSEIPHDQIRDRYVPALERVIDHIVCDTVINRLGIPLRYLPSFILGTAQVKAAYADFEQLMNLALAARQKGKGLWKEWHCCVFFPIRAASKAADRLRFVLTSFCRSRAIGIAAKPSLAICLALA